MVFFENSNIIVIGAIIALALLAFFMLVVTSPKSEEYGKKIKADAEIEDKAFPEKNLPKYRSLFADFFTHIEIVHGQNKKIYRLTLATISIGFIFIALGSLIYMRFAFLDYADAGIESALTNISISPLSLILAGAFTEVIAIIILLVYRSVSRQTEAHFKSLERLTTIGVAVQLVDDLANDPGVKEELKSIAKADIAKKLLDFNDNSSNQVERRAKKSS